MQKLPLKWRWRLVIGGILLLYLASFEYNIKKTITIVSDYNNNYETLMLAKREVNNISALKNTKSYKESNITRQDSFYHYLSEYCDSNSVEITEIKQSFLEKDSITIETNKVTLNGDFNNLLRLIYAIEIDDKVNPINSATFELSKNKNDGTFYLSLILYIKRLIHENK